ncbi:NADPH:quinone reductase [Pontibacillus halophilus JSM 076056 = DSM 19796]|uniref:NADPH:quinone reductase n=1 Tax=Pontibacillus halophilus JSM 076056 = DSM 19796 TaxID=1385510 RepID=A0A0A5GRK4_9BACI|nr:NADP-dependent oxidoreductase [Pontibacillus halophilus]KGX93800.1 NADPH:quinone reductase [Pontibacillus halophilus JSM 076056 = DSM 19796]
MNAVVIEQYGGTEVLKGKEVPTPEIERNQVLVEVYATSINPIDWKVREGYLQEMLKWDFPIILGWDVAGIITEVGEDVEGYKPGDRVFARPATTNQGTYAEYVPVDESLLAPLPDGVKFSEAASVPLAGLTAWQCLFDSLNIQEGDHVLIHAGSGGVGSFAIQFAKEAGAYVSSTASGSNEELLKSLGVDQFINYKDENFEDVVKDVDAVLDTLGGDVQAGSLRTLKQGGKLVSIVGVDHEELAKERGVHAEAYWLEPDGEQLAAIGSLLEQKKVKPIVGHVFEFNEQGVKEAHELSATHHARGKIVIQMKEDDC